MVALGLASFAVECGRTVSIVLMGLIGAARRSERPRGDGKGTIYDVTVVRLRNGRNRSRPVNEGGGGVVG